MLILRKPWDSQPQEATGLDRENPVTQDLVESFEFGAGGVYDAARGILINATYTDATPSVAQHGRQFTIANAAANTILIPSVVARPTQYSVVIAVRASSVAWVSFGALCALAASNGDGIISVQNNSSPSALGVFHNNTSFVSSGVAAATYVPNDGTTWVVVGVGWDGTNEVFWKNGSFVSTAAMAAPPNTTVTADRWYIGNGRTPTVCRPGDYLFLRRWNRCLADAEFAQMTQIQSSSSIFAPRRIFIPVSAGGGGGTTFTFAVSGGVTFGGASAIARGRSFPVSGGISFGGVGTTTHGKIIIPSGGISFSGNANTQHTKINATSGGVVFGGTAPITFANGAFSNYVFSVSGGIVLGGASNYAHTKVFSASGGVTFSGNNTFVKGRVTTPSGGIVFGGTNNMTFNDAVSVRTPERTKTGAGT